jgi:hypothetical protein
MEISIHGWFSLCGGLIDNAHRRFKRAVNKGEISIAALIRVFRIVYTYLD